MFQRIKIRSFERGLLFRDGEFERLLTPGVHWRFDPLRKYDVDIVSTREPRLDVEKLDLVVKSGALENEAVVLDLKDHERALVWVDGRFHAVLSPGLHAFWSTERVIRTEVVDAREVRFTHPELPAILRTPYVGHALEVCTVPADHAGVLFVDGEYVETLTPGRYTFWRGERVAQTICVDLRETTVDVGGQEIMTSDKVTLRLNALVSYRVVDALRTVSRCDDARQALYRETQLALRGVVGERELDALLSDKEAVAAETRAAIVGRAQSLGLELISVGVRDVILPGDMKELMNRVTEAKKAAEANLIVRREETAAMRSQANTAKLLADNPVLMRLKELEVLQEIASSGKLSVVLGDGDSEGGLASKVVNLL